MAATRPHDSAPAAPAEDLAARVPAQVRNGVQVHVAASYHPRPATFRFPGELWRQVLTYALGHGWRPAGVLALRVGPSGLELAERFASTDLGAYAKPFTRMDPADVRGLLGALDPSPAALWSQLYLELGRCTETGCDLM